MKMIIELLGEIHQRQAFLVMLTHSDINFWQRIPDGIWNVLADFALLHSRSLLLSLDAFSLRFARPFPALAGIWPPELELLHRKRTIFF